MCSAALNLWREANTYLAEKRENLLATANVVAGASSEAVASQNLALIRASLRSVARVPGLAYGRIENSNGETLAQVGATVRLRGELAIDSDRQGSVYDLLKTRTVQVVVPIVYGGRPAGRLLLIGETGDLVSRFISVVTIGSLGSALAIAVGLFIAHGLQRSITRPLTALAGDMTRIALTQDYSSSVPPTSDVETQALAGSFNVMIDAIRKASLALSDREAELIFRLSRATEKRDNETGTHIVRMAHLCRLIGEGLDLDKQVVEDLHRVAPLHDVGKIAVPDSIMLKEGKLDPSERREMEKHTGYGYEILRNSDSDLIRQAADMAWSHHERWDGGGYPRGLKGEEIPLVGRVAAVADVCDALATKRPYKPAWSLESVRTHLIGNSGTHFDPACVAALLNRWSEVDRIYQDND